MTRLSHRAPYERLGPDIKVGPRPVAIFAVGDTAWVVCAGDGTVREITAGQE